MTEADYEFMLSELEQVNPDMIDALTLSVLAAVELGELKLFGDTPFDEELDSFLSRHGIRY